MTMLCSLEVYLCPTRINCSWYFCKVITDITLSAWKSLYITGHRKINMCFFVCSCCHIQTDYLWIISTTLVHNRDLVFWNDLLQCYKSSCTVKPIKPRRLYQAMLDMDLPWFTIDIRIDSIKESNGYYFLPFTW